MLIFWNVKVDAVIQAAENEKADMQQAVDQIINEQYPSSFSFFLSQNINSHSSFFSRFYLFYL